MRRVFVIQNQHRAVEGRLEPKFDLSSAEAYGELVYLLSPTARPFESAHVISQLWDRLKDFNDEDSLLLIGNPALIGFAVAIASTVNAGRIRVLQWDGRRGAYTAIKANIRDREHH